MKRKNIVSLIALLSTVSLWGGIATFSVSANTQEQEFTGISLDFADESAESQFTTAWGGWEVKEGKFMPSVGWGSTYLHTAIPFGTETVTISLDFYFEESANNPELWIGLVDDAEKVPTESTGDGVSLRLSASGEGLYTAFSGNYGQWITETDVGFAGAKHTVQMVFTADKKVTVTVDGNALSHSAAGLTMTNIGYAAKYDFDSAFLSFKSVGTNNYVDNISVTVGESEEEPGGDVVISEDVSIDFETSADGSQFTTAWGGWGIKEGKFMPSVGWGSTYFNSAIPFGTETVTISLDFYFEESANNPELWIGLVDDAGKVPTDSTGDGVSLRLSASGEGLYTAFSGNYGQWLTETDVGFAGAKHTVQMVFTADKKVTVTVDGNALSHSAAGLTMTNIGYAAKYDFDSAFLSFKSVGTNNYVDNISIVLGETEGPEVPGGDPEVPGGDPEVPGGDPEVPGGDPEVPGGDPEIPGGDPEIPGGDPEVPGGDPEVPGGDPEVPGGDPEVPGGDPEVPGGDPEVPGGDPETPAKKEDKNSGCSGSVSMGVLALSLIVSGVFVVRKNKKGN